MQAIKEPGLDTFTLSATHHLKSEPEDEHSEFSFFLSCVLSCGGDHNDRPSYRVQSQQYAR